jgi:hypothetical protein
MRWVGNVARVEEKRNVCGVLVGRPELTDRLENLGVDGRIIIKWISNKSNGGVHHTDLDQYGDRLLAVQHW